jgi:chromate reductase
MPKEAQTMTVRITGIAGSLRRESFNRKLLHAAAHEMPHGAELTVWDGLGAVPPFSEDLEAAPAPAGVTDLRQVIAEADGLLFATPEYNGSVPGQLKNAIDWASRPRRGVLQGKPAAVISASPAPYGAAWAQADLRKILKIAGPIHCPVRSRTGCWQVSPRAGATPRTGGSRRNEITSNVISARLLTEKR